MNRTLTISILLTMSLNLSHTSSFSAVTPTEEAAASFPPIWEKAGPRERLKAVRVAELDADRLLVERIYGMEVDADTTIGDLALENDDVATAVRATLVGAVTVGEPDYLEDGRVQLVRAVKIQEITETLERTTKRKIQSDGTSRIHSDSSETTKRVQDKVIDAMGNGAIPNSEGHVKIMAKRAAELDAYRRLAGRMMGVTIEGESTVRDFCLDSDRVVAGLSHALRAATPTAIKYLDDGSTEVTMEIKVADVIRTTKRMIGTDREKTEITDEIETRSFSETGIGVMHPALEADSESMASSSQSSGEPFFETRVIIKQVAQSTPVIQ